MHIEEPFLRAVAGTRSLRSIHWLHKVEANAAKHSASNKFCAIIAA